MKKFFAGVTLVSLGLISLSPVQSANGETIDQRTLSSFVGGVTGLSPAQKNQVRAAVEANPLAERFICTGVRFFQQPASENIKVRQRAKAACDFASTLNPSLAIWVQTKSTRARSFAGKVLLTIKTPADPVDLPIPEPSPSQTAQSPTNSPGPAISASPVTSEPPMPLGDPSPASIEICKVPDGRPLSQSTLRPGTQFLGTYGMSNVGFPHSPDLFPVKGEVNFIVVPVAFKDMKGSPQEIDSYLEEQTKKLTEWSEYWSQGQLRYTFQLVRGWQEIPHAVSEFRVADVSRGNRTVEIHVGLANAIAKKVGVTADWNRAHGMFALFPTGFNGIPGEYALRGDIVETPIGAKSFFMKGGGEFHLTGSPWLGLQAKRDLLWSYWAHEILHSQGSNLHAPGNGWPVGVDRNQYPAGGGKVSGAIGSWEAFKKGWILDSQVHCVDARGSFSASNAVLTPLEIRGGDRKIVLVRTKQHEGIMVESRRPVGFSATWSTNDSGIMVSSLNTTVMNDRTGEATGDCGNNRRFAKWSYFLPSDQRPAPANPCGFEPFIIKPGETVTWDGVTVTLVRSAAGADLVSIRKAN